MVPRLGLETRQIRKICAMSTWFDPTRAMLVLDKNSGKEIDPTPILNRTSLNQFFFFRTSFE